MRVRLRGAAISDMGCVPRVFDAVVCCQVQHALLPATWFLYMSGVCSVFVFANCVAGAAVKLVAAGSVFERFARPSLRETFGVSRLKIAGVAAPRPHWR